MFYFKCQCSICMQPRVPRSAGRRSTTLQRYVVNVTKSPRGSKGNDPVKGVSSIFLEPPIFSKNYGDRTLKVAYVRNPKTRSHSTICKGKAPIALSVALGHATVLRLNIWNQQYLFSNTLRYCSFPYRETGYFWCLFKKFCQ